jgi:hypothetical protein
VGCVFPDLDDDDPVLYAQGLPHRDPGASLGAAHGIDSVRTDSLQHQEPLALPAIPLQRWPIPDEESPPAQPDLGPERPPPRLHA